jgi:transposase-like protein
MANKPKYSKELAERIAGLIESDQHTVDEICSLSGITRKTFYKWKRERFQFAGLITRVEDKKTEKEVVEAKRSLMKILKGFEIKEVRDQVKNLKNGEQKREITVITKSSDPEFKLIKFVLENKDSKHFRNAIHRALKFHERRSRNQG